MTSLSTATITRSDLFHLDYGLRAGRSKQGKLIVFHGTNATEFQLADPRLYRAFFQSSGVEFFGYESISVGGIDHPSWELFYDGQHDVHRSVDYIISGMKNTLIKGLKSEQGDLVRNVAFGLRAMTYRLRDVSSAYGDQVVYAIAGDTLPGHRFSNLGTINIFLNIHSFLVETGTLRDHIAALLSANVFATGAATMAELLRHLRKTSPDSALGSELLQICDRSDPSGWMARLGELRNTVVHSAPISALGPRPGMTRIQVTIGGSQFPGVRFDVPQDPILAPNGAKSDALRQCVEIARKMIDFFRRAVSDCGFLREPVHITDADIK